MTIAPEILAQVRRIQVRTNRMVTDVMAGGYLSVFRGAGIEFEEVREFAEGDDLRSIDWNVTARVGRPHVKKFVEERELTVLFLLDVSGSTRFSSAAQRSVRELSAQFCACIALAASRNNDKAGLVAFTDRIERYVPSKKGPQHVLRLIREALALEPAGTGTDLAAALDYAARVQRKRAVVFVVSDFLEEPSAFERSLQLLARRHDVVAARIQDPATRALPAAGLLRLRDLETGAAQWVDTGSARVRAAYAQKVAAADAARTQLFRRAGVDEIAISLQPGASLVEPILRFFRMRERRGAHG